MKCILGSNYHFPIAMSQFLFLFNQTLFFNKSFASRDSFRKDFWFQFNVVAFVWLFVFSYLATPFPFDFALLDHIRNTFVFLFHQHCNSLKFVTNFIRQYKTIIIQVTLIWHTFLRCYSNWELQLGQRTKVNRQNPWTAILENSERKIVLSFRGILQSW